MAGILTLATSVQTSTSYVGDPYWIEAGTNFTVQQVGSAATNRRIEGSLDGENWFLVAGLDEVLYFYTYLGADAASGFIVDMNYIRYSHDSGSAAGSITVMAIQPNFKKIDVNSLPA